MVKKGTIESAQIVYNRAVLPHYYRMAIDWAPTSFEPGQFIMLRVSPCYDPLLRRPFGIYNLSPQGTEILYRVVGRGTELMAQLKAGDRVDVFGPLGRGFELEGAVPHILVAGGIGIAPFYSVAKALVEMGTGVKLLFGVRTPQELALAEDIKALGIDAAFAVEKQDGRLATDLLLDEPLGGKRVLACGPEGMLRAVAEICGEHGADSFLSVETSMACGMGICMGCVVETPSGYRLACVDGPVFPAGELLWKD